MAVFTVCLALLASVAVGSPAGADTRRITAGDVQGVFDAFGNGGWAILGHSRAAAGAPADFLGSHGAIRPFAAWDGKHFCVEDWHVLLIADIEGGDASFTQADAAAVMDTLTVTLTLDGVGLATTRTAIKRFLNPDMFGLVTAYYFQEGRIMSPADLGVGTHRLSVAIADPTGVTFRNAIRFVVDSASTGACV